VPPNKERRGRGGGGARRKLQCRAGSCRLSQGPPDRSGCEGKREKRETNVARGPRGGRGQKPVTSLSSAVSFWCGGHGKCMCIVDGPRRKESERAPGASQGAEKRTSRRMSSERAARGGSKRSSASPRDKEVFVLVEAGKGERTRSYRTSVDAPYDRERTPHAIMRAAG